MLHLKFFNEPRSKRSSFRTHFVSNFSSWNCLATAARGQLFVPFVSKPSLLKCYKQSEHILSKIDGRILSIASDNTRQFSNRNPSRCLPSKLRHSKTSTYYKMFNCRLIWCIFTTPLLADKFTATYSVFCLILKLFHCWSLIQITIRLNNPSISLIVLCKQNWFSFIRNTVNHSVDLFRIYFPWKLIDCVNCAILPFSPFHSAFFGVFFLRCGIRNINSRINAINGQYLPPQQRFYHVGDFLVFLFAFGGCLGRLRSSISHTHEK